jgi:hypothetical protein
MLFGAKVHEISNLYSGRSAIFRVVAKLANTVSETRLEKSVSCTGKC